tara:strand:+ start:34 stop:198 length:165 start_codon:yes stop_codon:yes gene_type:complete
MKTKTTYVYQVSDSKGNITEVEFNSHFAAKHIIANAPKGEYLNPHFHKAVVKLV